MSERIMTNAEVKWAYEQWIRGYTYDEIGKAMYYSPKTIYREFQRRGWK